MKYYQPKENRQFIGRKSEWSRLALIDSVNEAQIVVVYGRHRVGKTELIEQYFRNRNLLKFEGIQCEAPKSGSARISLERKQVQQSLVRFFQYQEKPELIGKIAAATWTDFFSILSPCVEKEAVTLYFEESQWLAAYGSNFFAEMQPFWDDKWRHNPNLRIVITGSSPAFLLSQFLSNKALYNRSNHIFELKPFGLSEVEAFLPRCGAREVFVAMLTVGGVPEYLKRLKAQMEIRPGKGVLSSVAHEFFHSEGAFSGEFDKIFVSSLSENTHYKTILGELAQNRFLTRDELAARTGKNRSRPGGSFSKILEDMVACHFIEEYPPVFESGKATSKLKRYALSDEFVSFYLRCVAPFSIKFALELLTVIRLELLIKTSFKLAWVFDLNVGAARIIASLPRLLASKVWLITKPVHSSIESFQTSFLVFKLI